MMMDMMLIVLIGMFIGLVAVNVFCVVTVVSPLLIDFMILCVNLLFFVGVVALTILS
jgi:hypothetical protein